MLIAGPDGVRIAFETAGTGPPLVLLHGFFGDRGTWRSAGYVEALGDAFRLVLIDARGHGGSDAPHDPAAYGLGRQVDDVVAVLDALGIDRAALWGSSMGGIIGLHLLARHPERVAALVAGGAHGDAVTADPGEVERENELFRTEGTAPFIAELERSGVLPAWMRTAMQAADPPALAALNTALSARGSVLEALARTSVPVLLLAGDQDPLIPAIRETAARMTGAALAELPGCGHFEAFLRTDLAVPAVRSFLAG